MGRSYNGRRPQHWQFANGTRKDVSPLCWSSSTGNLHPAKTWLGPWIRRDVHGEWRRTTGMFAFTFAMRHSTAKQRASDRVTGTVTSKIIARRSNTLLVLAAG